MRPNGHSYPPPHPSPLRKASPLPSLPDERRYTFQDSSDQADSQTPVAPHPEVSCNLDQKMMITDSPALGTSMAFTGLQLDVGYTNAASWSYPPPVSYEYSTISPSSLLQSPSHGNCRSSRKSQPQSYPSQSISSHEFDYRSSSYLSTPPSFLDDTSTALMSDNLTWTPADSVFREQCHLNVSEDDPHLGHDPPNWQAARICEPSVETSSTASDQSVHSAAMERGLSHEAHRSPSRDTSYAPSTRTPSIQLDTEPRPSRRRLTRPEDVRLRCPVCGKGFARTFNYNTHLQIHNPNRRRPCRCLHPGCDKDFFRDTDLRRHEQSVSRKICFEHDEVHLLTAIRYILVARHSDAKTV